MASSFNAVTLLGNVTRDIELRYIPSGTAVCDMSLAVNDVRKGANGEKIEECSFIECVCWGRTAEIANEYLAKGNPVLVHGRLKQETWEKDGQKRSKIKVVVERLVLLGKGGGGGGRPPAGDAAEPAGNPATDGVPSGDPGDIPF